MAGGEKEDADGKNWEMEEEEEEEKGEEDDEEEAEGILTIVSKGGCLLVTKIGRH